MITVGIIGLGRFGQLLYQILKDDFECLATDHTAAILPQQTSLQQVLQQENIFLCVPIHALQSLLYDIAPNLKANQTILDVCSVKYYPSQWMKQILPTSVNIIATHPLFGPDSWANASVKKIIMHAVNKCDTPYSFWKNYFTQKTFEVIEMSPEDHDHLSAKTQAISHLIGRLLSEIKAESTPINTLSYEFLLQVKEMMMKDSLQLFCDLFRYNPFAQKELDAFKTGLAHLESLLT